MNFPNISTQGLVGIRYFSDINPWIDFVVFVKQEAVGITASEIAEAMDEFWLSTDNSECYGDIVERKISSNYLIIFHDDEDESWEYEEAWENMVRESKPLHDNRIGGFS